MEIDKNVEISTEKVKESKDEKPKERKIDVDDKSDVSSQETDTTASDKFGSGHIDATLREHFFKEFFTNDEFVKRLSSEIGAQLFQLQKRRKRSIFLNLMYSGKNMMIIYLYSLFTLPHKKRCSIQIKIF